MGDAPSGSYRMGISCLAAIATGGDGDMGRWGRIFPPTLTTLPILLVDIRFFHIEFFFFVAAVIH